MKVTTHNGRVILAPEQKEATPDLQDLSESQFLMLGLTNVAYIRSSVTEDGDIVCAIHAADGSPLAVVDDIETAWGIIVQNNMVPTSLQ